MARQRRQDERNERLDEANSLISTFQHILELHREEFPAAGRPLAPVPVQPDRATIYAHFERQVLQNVGRFKRAEREQARRQATAWADAEAGRLWQEQLHGHAQAQGWLDHCWSQLCANVPEVVMDVLAQAFEDNEVPSAPVDMAGDEVSLALLAPGIDEVVPERLPSVTQAGNISLRKIPKKERSAYYTTFVCAQALVTVREAFAVAPGIRSARVVVLRADRPDVYGQPRISCLLAAAFDRDALDRVMWQSAGAVDIVNDVSRERLFQQGGPTKDLVALDLAGEPDLRALVEAVDLSDLGIDAAAALAPPVPAPRRADAVPARPAAVHAAPAPAASQSPIDEARLQARQCRCEVDRLIAAGGAKPQLNQRLTTVITPCLEMTKNLTTTLGQQVIDVLKMGEDPARSQQALTHLQQAMDLMGKSLDNTGLRGPYELLAEIDAVLWSLDGAWQAIGPHRLARRS